MSVHACVRGCAWVCACTYAHVHVCVFVCVCGWSLFVVIPSLFDFCEPPSVYLIP